MHFTRTETFGPTVGDPRAAGSSDFDLLYVRHPKRWLVVILAAYLVAAFSYVLMTPSWQAPDEPAHYNYIKQIASGNGLPVLQAGDYDQDLLENLLQMRFSPALPIDALRYESYQPPLYYLVATPVFWLSGGSLVFLRLMSIMIGACSLLLIYLCLICVFPEKYLISLGATAFAALLPMHIAMSAAVNNDGLAELLVLAATLMLLYWMRNRYMPGARANARASAEIQQLLLLGLLLGLGMLTKIYAHMVLGVVVGTVYLVAWRHPTVEPGVDGAASRFRFALRPALWVLIPAILLALPMWWRNLALYGGLDFLGLNWHDQVVVGQPRTAEWIAEHGWTLYAERAFGFTFRSFWGVFGWLNVFIDERIYSAFMLFTGILFMGLLWAVVRLISGQPDTDMNAYQVSVLILFGVLFAAVTASYVWYNTKFVQHQGRYFFWALLPICTFMALSWREVLHPVQGLITGVLAGVLAGALAVTGYFSGGLDKWSVVTIGMMMLFLLLQPLLLAGTRQGRVTPVPGFVQRWAQRRRVAGGLALLRPVAWATPFWLLFLLNLVIPGIYILPMLAPIP